MLEEVTSKGGSTKVVFFEAIAKEVEDVVLVSHRVVYEVRIEQYIQMIDYALWEVIENGATLPKIAVVEGVEKVMPIISAEDKA
ncbi:hypothetical protein Tco_0371307 [Tanacetum coccineum]